MMKTIVMVWNSQNEKEEFLAQISQKVKELYDCEKIDVCTFDEDEINKILVNTAIKSTVQISKVNEENKLYGDEMIEYLSKKFGLIEYKSNPNKTNLFFTIGGALMFSLSKPNMLKSVEDKKLICAIKSLAKTPLYHINTATNFGYTQEVERIVKKLYDEYLSKPSFSKEDDVNGDTGISITVK